MIMLFIGAMAAGILLVDKVWNRVLERTCEHRIA